MILRLTTRHENGDRSVAPASRPAVVWASSPAFASPVTTRIFEGAHGEPCSAAKGQPRVSQSHAPRRPGGQPRTSKSAPSCTANKIEINNSLSVTYATIPCRISLSSKETAKSLQPQPSLNQTLCNRNITKRLPARYVSPRVATTGSTLSYVL